MKVPQWAAAIKVAVLAFKEQHLNDGAILGKKRHQGMWVFRNNNLFVVVAVYILMLPETLVVVNDLLRVECYAALMTSSDLTRPPYMKYVINLLNGAQWPPNKRAMQEMTENNDAK